MPATYVRLRAPSACGSQTWDHLLLGKNFHPPFTLSWEALSGASWTFIQERSQCRRRLRRGLRAARNRIYACRCRLLSRQGRGERAMRRSAAAASSAPCRGITCRRRRANAQAAVERDLRERLGQVGEEQTKQARAGRNTARANAQTRTAKAALRPRQRSWPLICLILEGRPNVHAHQRREAPGAA